MSCIKTLKPPPFQNLLFSFPTMFEKPRKTTLSAYLMRDGNINLKSLLQSLLKQTLTFFYTTKWLESVTSSPKAPIHPRDRLMVYRTVRQNTDYFLTGNLFRLKQSMNLKSIVWIFTLKIPRQRKLIIWYYSCLPTSWFLWWKSFRELLHTGKLS